MEMGMPPTYSPLLKLLYGRDDGASTALGEENISYYEKCHVGNLAIVRALSEELKQELRDRDTPDGEICIWFDEGTRKCKHYNLRPDMCRDFELGGENCHSWRQKMAIDQSREQL